MSNWRNDLLTADRIAFDIEIRDTETLLCCGFAASPKKAYVFTANREDEIREILTHPVSKVAQNAAFDVFWLKTRWGVDVANVNDDTMLAWHALYPELAGSSDQKSYKASRKSLAFLASLYCRDPYWKYYGGDDHEMFQLNGIDCCLTLEIMEKLDGEIDQLDVRDVYEHNLSLVPVVVDMQARGLKVDEEKRQKRIRQLTERFDELDDTVNEIALPIIEDHRDRLEDVWHLFEVGGFETETGRRETCPCCNGGKAKSESCWECAGFDSSPNKSEVVEKYGNPDDLNKDELIDEVIPECQVCDGDGKRTELWINPRSRTQIKHILYDALKMPKRYSDGSLTVDEDALKNLRATLGP